MCLNGRELVGLILKRLELAARGVNVGLLYGSTENILLLNLNNSEKK